MNENSRNASATSKSSRRVFCREVAGIAAAASLAGWTSKAAGGGRQGSRLKVGQIGVGHAHAKGKIEAFRKSPDWEVVGVVEDDPKLREEAQRDEAYRDIPFVSQGQLLNTSGLKAVAIETRVRDLLAAAEPCVAAGKHIHIDKPPGADFPRFKQLMADAERQGLTVQLGYMYRYNPGIVLMHQFLEKGWLGEPFEVHAVMSKQVGRSKRQRWAETPGGTMFELGCHLIDLMVGVLGRPDAVTPYVRHSGEFDDNLPDNMLAVCTYPKATAAIRSTALEVEGFDRRHFVVCGAEGTMQIEPLDDPRVRVALSQKRGSYEAEYQTVDVGPYERYVDDVAELASVIRGEKEFPYSKEHDLATQETVLKASELWPSA